MTIIELERELAQLRATIEADNRDWNVIATELGLVEATREQIIKTIREWRRDRLHCQRRH
jgi:hypothetical protein